MKNTITDNYFLEQILLNLYRIEDDKKIAGVCAGLAESIKVDTNIVRVFFILAMIFVNGLGFWLYLALVLLLPRLPDGENIEKFDPGILEKAEINKYVGPGFVVYGIYLIFSNLNFYWFGNLR